MIFTTRRSRWLLGIALVLIFTVASFFCVGALIPSWNAAPGQAGQILPGDELVPQPQIIWNHAITIHATPEQIYPWLAQMGDSRGAYYSFTFIENLFMLAGGVDGRYVNADRIHPEWQNPQAGQGMIVDALTLHAVELNRYVLASATPVMGEIQWTWLWYLEPVDANNTRLLVRHRFYFPAEAPLGAVRVVLNAGYVMERGMLLGIRDHAEGHIPSPAAEPLGAALWLVALAMGGVAARQFLRAPRRWAQLGLGLAALALLFLFTFVQPAPWMRALLDLALLAGLFVAGRRGGVQPASPAS